MSRSGTSDPLLTGWVGMTGFSGCGALVSLVEVIPRSFLHVATQNVATSIFSNGHRENIINCRLLTLQPRLLNPWTLIEQL